MDKIGIGGIGSCIAIARPTIRREKKVDEEKIFETIEKIGELELEIKRDVRKGLAEKLLRDYKSLLYYKKKLDNLH